VTAREFVDEGLAKKIEKGEIFIPKMKLQSIKEMANKISKKHKITGIRRGEKIQEILITDEEKKMAKENKNMWIIQPYSS